MPRVPLFFAVLFFIVIGIFFLRSDQVEASGTITGTVYIDYNMNGTRNTTGAYPDLAIDSGVNGVTVTVYASNGDSKSTITDASGSYSINTSAAPALPNGPYRVEFTSLPNGYSPSVVGGANGTTVAYVPNGNSSNVSLGIISNPDYCQNDPDVYLPVSSYGEQTSMEPALIQFPYRAGADFTDPDTGAGSEMESVYAQPDRTSILQVNQLGTTWGTTYQRSTNRLFIAAHFKRHFGFLTNTTASAAAIYVANPATGSVITTYTVPGITANAHLSGGTTYEQDGNNAGWDAVGKQSIGGIDVSDDDENLYAMNLENRTLYRFNANTGAVINSVSTTSLTMPTPGGTEPNCVTANKRPFAVKYHQGRLYLGFVCSGEPETEKTPLNLSDLRAYVFTAHPTTLAIAPAPVVNIRLDYTRGYVSEFGGEFPAEWNPWQPTFSNQTGSSGEVSYPQPILKGIAFQGTNMILGIADRFGDQVGYLTESDPNNSELHIANSAGDTLKLCGDPTLGWTLESNGLCGGQGTGPQNNGQGPGNGEFFFQDYFMQGGAGHQENTTGGIDVIPGVPQVISTVYDPVDNDTTNPINFDWAFTQGIRFLNTTTGQTDRAYYVNRTEYSKGNDLGQVVVACRPAPLQIGNRIWLDSNRNGIQEPDENPLANVVVELYVDSDGDGTPDLLVGTATTDLNGNYVFGGPNNSNLTGTNSILPNTAYEVRIPTSNFATPTGPLAFLLPSPTAADATANGTSRDSNGEASGTYVRALVTTGSYAQNNHTVDFGFMLPPTSAGIIVAGRVVDPSGRGLPRVKVTITNPQTSAVKTVITNSFGYFSFSDLEAGDSYVVSVSAKAYNFDPDTQFIKAYSSINNVLFTSSPPAQKGARTKK